MKYKYATTRRNKSSLASFIGNKKHRCRKLLNSKNLVAGLITVVGSMLMMAQSEAQTLLQWTPNPIPVLPQTGTWDNGVTPNWDSVPFNNIADTTWNNAATAPLTANFTFGNVGGTVSVAPGGVTTDIINVNPVGGSFLFTGAGTITLQGAATVNVSGTHTIAALIGGTNGLTVSAGGNLIVNNQLNNNSFTGETTVTAASTITLAATSFGSSLDNASDVNLQGASILNVFDDEIVGGIDGDAASRVVMGLGTSIFRITETTTSTHAGFINGTGNLEKSGSGTWTLQGTNTYAGQTEVLAGVLHIQNNAALGAVGAGNNTVVSNNAQLMLSGGINTPEEIHATGDGPGSPGTGAILSNGLNNTLSGNIFIQGATRIGNEAAGTTLTIAADVDASTAEIAEAGVDHLWLGGAGNIVFDGTADAKIDDDDGGLRVSNLVKYGTGTVDIRNLGGSGDHDHTGENVIRDGTLRMIQQTNLGNGALPVPGGFDYGVTFADETAKTRAPKLRVDATGGDVSLTATRFAFAGVTGGVVGTMRVDGANTVFTEAGNDPAGPPAYGHGYTSDSDQNVLLKDGIGTLAVNFDSDDDTFVGAAGLSVCELALGLDRTLDFAAGSGLALNIAAGELVFDNSGNPRALLTVNGLGGAGDLTLDTLNLQVNDTVAGLPAFTGTLTTDGAVGFTAGDTTINSDQSATMTGQIIIGNGATLTIGHAGALGSNGNYTTNGTYVCADGTLALGGTLTGGDLNESITLFNNGLLTNIAGTNTVTEEIHLFHDPLGNPNSHTAQIGATAGMLSIDGGIDAHNTPGDMNLALNTRATDAGIVDVDSEIEATVVDLDIGEAGQTAPTGVYLRVNNSYTGQTRIHGAFVEVSANAAFSSGLVTVVNSAYIGNNLGSSTLANKFQVDAGATLSGYGNLGISGVIAGAGNLSTNDLGAPATMTLSGANTYSGTTTVSNNAGTGSTLNVGNTLASPTINVEALGTLNTNGTELLDNAATVNANGTWNLGGNETIGVLNGSGTVDIGTSSITAGSGLFTGTIQNSHGALNKIGAGTLTFNGANLAFAGGIHVEAGTLQLLNGTTAVSTYLEIDGGSTVDITNSTLGGGVNPVMVDIDQFGTLNLSGANIAAAGSVLDVDGTLNVNNNSNVWKVTGDTGGLINLNNNSTLFLNGIDFDGTIAGNGGLGISGNLNLDGNNTFSGPLSVAAGGTVFLNGTVDANVVTVMPSGELVLGSSERIQDGSVLNNNGTLTLSGNETVVQYNSAGLTRGNGMILAPLYNLNNGAVTQPGANLGDGVLNTNGTVLLGGNKTGGADLVADVVNVQSGVLNLTGTITDPVGLAVNVLAGTLNLGFDERIGDNAVLTSNGTVNLNGTETVTTFNLSGPNSMLGGSGLLNANTYNLANGATTKLGANMGLGVLNVSGAAQVTLGGESAAATVNINAGADLFLNGNERLTYAETDVHGVVTNANAAVINNLGTLTLGGTETVETNNMTGATLAGAGTLNAVTHNLTNSTTNAGTVLNGKGTDMGTLNLAGVNVLNGNANVGTVNVNATTTTLNGLLTKSGVVINIADPTDVADATLVLGAAERINNTATINNDGTLTLNGTETIGTFNSSGNLNGAGTLIGIGNTVNLLNGHISFNGTTIQDFSGNAANPSLTSNGAVTINGTAGSQSSVLNARLNVNFAEIQSGTMFLNGLFIGSPNLTINNTATLQSGSADRVSNAANVTIDNGGVWNMGGNDTINTLSAGGQLNSQPHTLTALAYTLTGGADINANLGTGVLNSNNSVLGLSNRLDGNAAVHDANITSGVFNLNGQLTVVNTVDISNGATVNLGSSERIANGATVNNFGELDLNGNETVTTYNANGGFLDNSGTLTAITYNLSNGASTDVGANLGTGTLNSTGGSVTLNGNTNANVINIDNGVLTTEGAVQNASGVITVDPFASWNVNNTNFTYARLQGEGTVDAYTIGTFVNENTVAPGQFNGDIGTLNIGGNYRENDTLEIEFNTGASDFFNHDVLDVAGYVTLNSAHSILDLEEVGAFDADNIQCGERFHIIDSAGTINGAWSSIGGSTILANQTFGTQVLFDLGSGDVVGTGLAQFETIADIPNIDSNQLAVLTAITDSAIDTVGNYDSSDAGTGNVLDHILQACDAGGNAGKLAAINSTMPEGYAGAADYALHATRSYTETIMQTTPFGASAGSVEYDEKGQVTSSTAGGGHSLQAFGGYHSMELASDSSNNGHDYDMDSSGGYAGVRATAGDKLAYGAFVGVDSGSVDAAALNLDADGYVIGALAHYQASDKIGVWASLSYGSFSFDGHRRVFGSNLTVKEFDADAFQVGVGADYEAYNSNGFKVTPGLGLRFIDASTDSITETGGPAALNIDGIDADALLLDLTVKFAYMPEGGNYGVTGYIGYQHDFQDGDRDVDAMFASGSPYFRVNAPGLGDSAFTYGIGGYYDFTEDLRFSVNYRGESRSDADEMHSIDLRLTYGF